MILWTLLEGLGLGALLVAVCAVGIKDGAVGMAHLYHEDVQARCVALGLTTRERIKRSSARFKACCLPVYIAYALMAVYALNGARGFADGFWQLLVILSVMNLVDPRHGGPEALHHRAGQAQKVALRHGRHGRHRGDSGRSHGADSALRD